MSTHDAAPPLDRQPPAFASLHKSTMQKIALPLVACLLALATTGASAQAIYKWRDASGQMHISDTPPPSDVPAKNVLSRPTPAPVAHPGADAASDAGAAGGAATPAAAANPGDSDLMKKKAKLDQDKAQAAAVEKAKADQKQADARAASCTSAQQQARNMSAGGRIARVNANGEREYLDDAAIASELKRAQDIVAQTCGPAKAPQY